MNNVKIGIVKRMANATNAKTFGMDATHTQSHQYEVIYTIWHFKFYVTNNFNSPLIDLHISDFTFKFLNSFSSHILDSSEGNSRIEVQMFHAGGLYFINVWQPTSLQNLHSGEYAIYPAEWLEVIIGNPSADNYGLTYHHLDQ